MIYLLKLKNKNFIISGFLVSLLGCLYIATQPKYISIQFWNIIISLVILVPAFFTCDIFSKEYENKSESFIFICGRPMYRQFLERFFVGWIIGEIAVFIIFFTAYAIGIELNFLKYIPILAISTFISLFGVFVGNVSKNSMLSYGIIIGLAIIGYSIPISVQESFIPLALFFNIVLREEIVWINVAYICFFSFILFMLNLWYISKGENIRLIIVKFCGVIVLLLTFTYMINIYIYNAQNKFSFNILNDNKDKYVVVDVGCSVAKEYLNSKNLKYIEKQKLDDSDFNKDNLIIIAEEESDLSKSLKLKYKYIKQWNFDKRDLYVDNIGIQDVTAYRALLKNPNENKKNIIFIEAKKFAFKDLNTLFNKKYGNFLAVKNSKEIAKSTKRLNDLNLFKKDVSVIERETYLIQKGWNSKVVYRNMPYEKVSRVAYTWDAVIKTFNERFPQTEYNYPSTLYLYNKRDRIANKPDIVSEEIKNIKDFEMPRFFQDKNFAIEFSRKIFNDYILNNVSDKVLKDSWTEYYIEKKISKDLAEKLNNLNEEYSKLLLRRSDSYNDDLINNNKFFYSNERLIAANMLAKIDNKNGLANFTKEITTSNAKMDNIHIKQMCSKYVGENVCKTCFKEFETEKENTLEYVKKYNLDLVGF